MHREAVIQIVSDHYTIGLRVLFLCLLTVDTQKGRTVPYQEMNTKSERPVTDNKEQANGCWRILCNGIGEWGDYDNKDEAYAEANRLQNEDYVKEHGDNISVEWYPYKIVR